LLLTPHFFLWRIRCTISWSSGKFPVAFFEYNSSPSTAISKTPPPERISSARTPVAFWIAAARPAALGS
jgi:hypothetical protein